MTPIVTTETFSIWMKRLRDRAGAQRIAARIIRLQLGNPGQVNSVGAGVSELKIDFGPGYRVYYAKRGQELIVLLAGGDKDSQARDIAAALALWRDWKEENDG